MIRIGDRVVLSAKGLSSYRNVNNRRPNQLRGSITNITPQFGTVSIDIDWDEGVEWGGYVPTSLWREYVKIDKHYTKMKMEDYF